MKRLVSIVKNPCWKRVSNAKVLLNEKRGVSIGRRGPPWKRGACRETLLEGFPRVWGSAGMFWISYFWAAAAAGGVFQKGIGSQVKDFSLW